MKYIGTSASALLAAEPRATYQAVISRRPFFSRGITERLTSWPSIVRTVIDNSAGAAASPLGSPERSIDPDDDVAVIDYRVTARPGAATVATLVQQIEGSSEYIDVQSIEKRPGVPPLSQGGAQAFDAERDAAQDRAQSEAESNTLLARATDSALAVARGTRSTIIAVAVIAVVVGAIYFIPRPRGTAK